MVESSRREEGNNERPELSFVPVTAIGIGARNHYDTVVPRGIRMVNEIRFRTLTVHVVIEPYHFQNHHNHRS